MAFDAFIKFDTIEGETSDEAYKGWIEIESYSFGAQQKVSNTASSAGGASVGRVQLRELYFDKLADTATPKLYEACCKGQHIPSVTLVVNRAGGEKQKYLEIVMEEVLIADFIHSASLDEAREQIELNYGRLRVTYTQQKRKDGAGGGSITGGWDRIGNKVFS
jgi:type VI secretion system Hcp family effector